MKAGICPTVKQNWLLPFMHCLYCFLISQTQQLTTLADTSLHLLLLKNSTINLGSFSWPAKFNDYLGPIWAVLVRLVITSRIPWKTCQIHVFKSRESWFPPDPGQGSLGIDRFGSKHTMLDNIQGVFAHEKHIKVLIKLTCKLWKALNKLSRTLTCPYSVLGDLRNIQQAP